MGDNSLEPLGEIHTREMPDDGIAIWFHVSGGCTFVEPHGTPFGVEDAFTKMARECRHLEAVDLGAECANRLIRRYQAARSDKVARPYTAPPAQAVSAQPSYGVRPRSAKISASAGTPSDNAWTPIPEMMAHTSLISPGVAP